MASTPSASVSKRLVLVTVTAALGFFLFGYDTAVINGAIDALADHYGLGSGLKDTTPPAPRLRPVSVPERASTTATASSQYRS